MRGSGLGGVVDMFGAAAGGEGGEDVVLLAHAAEYTAATTSDTHNALGDFTVQWRLKETARINASWILG